MTCPGLIWFVIDISMRMLNVYLYVILHHQYGLRTINYRAPLISYLGHIHVLLYPHPSMVQHVRCTLICSITILL